ncbi:hypothetical protein O5D80_007034 [Batrachochytrium dendrobatidis]|nr:hypothetical protein O5D80_007034 [Batrachochytrium dendrobatidis]
MDSNGVIKQPLTDYKDIVFLNTFIEQLSPQKLAIQQSQKTNEVQSISTANAFSRPVSDDAWNQGFNGGNLAERGNLQQGTLSQHHHSQADRSSALVKEFYAFHKPFTHQPHPRLLITSVQSAALLCCDIVSLKSPSSLPYLTGTRLHSTAIPYAQNYGGHQYGMYAGQLGDGRCVSIGEVMDNHGERWTLQIKGCGTTQFSRTGDGHLSLRACLREFMVSEYMAAIGIPTTRCLAVVSTSRLLQRGRLAPLSAAPTEKTVNEDHGSPLESTANPEPNQPHSSIPLRPSTLNSKPFQPRRQLSFDHTSALKLGTSPISHPTPVQTRPTIAESAGILTRFAPTWIRFGSFELFHFRNDHHRVRELADYCIRTYYPEAESDAGIQQLVTEHTIEPGGKGGTYVISHLSENQPLKMPSPKAAESDLLSSPLTKDVKTFPSLASTESITSGASSHSSTTQNPASQIKRSSQTAAHIFNPLSIPLNKYAIFFRMVVKRTAEMVAHWQANGFVHGMLSSNNLSILGLTLHHGPGGFLDSYDPEWTPNQFDTERQYCLKQQPIAVQWNLMRLGRVLSDLIGESHISSTSSAPICLPAGTTLEEACAAANEINHRRIATAPSFQSKRHALTELVDNPSNGENIARKITQEFESFFIDSFTHLMCKKLGLMDPKPTDMDELITPLLDIMAATGVDYTLFFRALSYFKCKDAAFSLLVAYEPFGRHREDMLDEAVRVAGTGCMDPLTLLLSSLQRLHREHAEMLKRRSNGSMNTTSVDQHANFRNNNQTFDQKTRQDDAKKLNQETPAFGASTLINIHDTTRIESGQSGNQSTSETRIKKQSSEPKFDSSKSTQLHQTPLTPPYSPTHQQVQTPSIQGSISEANERSQVKQLQSSDVQYQRKKQLFETAYCLPTLMEISADWKLWALVYRSRLMNEMATENLPSSVETAIDRVEAMDAFRMNKMKHINPKYTLRGWVLDEVVSKAEIECKMGADGSFSDRKILSSSVITPGVEAEPQKKLANAELKSPYSLHSTSNPLARENQETTRRISGSLASSSTENVDLERIMRVLIGDVWGDTVEDEAGWSDNNDLIASEKWSAEPLPDKNNPSFKLLS